MAKDDKYEKTNKTPPEKTHENILDSVCRELLKPMFQYTS